MVKKKSATKKKSKKTQAGKWAPLSREELSHPEVLAKIFSKPNLKKALSRIAKRDKDDLLSHPLKSLILTEYRDAIIDQLVQSVPAGSWYPSGAYVSLTSKRSGAYRELVAPTLIDGIVGRCLIDALEPQINFDDDGKTFSGRTHFSNTREFGDYENWFQVWQDYTAAIDKAAENVGYAYVFDTDINDFFPSIDRTRAKALLAAKTGAHPSLLELLFYCLEAWLPRFSYSPMTGLPVEVNDVSRVVAHSYVKSVDAVFKNRDDCTYLRYVDDTVIFTKTAKSANTLRRLHHLELRQLGLNPNASKTTILPTEKFQARRHRDINVSISAAKNARDKTTLDAIATDWFACDRQQTHSWDKVARLLYSVAHQLRADTLRASALADAKDPRLSNVALRYLSAFDLTQTELIGLIELSMLESIDMQTAMAAAASLLDVRIHPKWSPLVVNAATTMLARRDNQHGIGLLKGLWLLVLHKHAKKRDLEELKSTVSISLLDDHVWRLHYLYVAIATGATTIAKAGSASTLANSDLQLALRLCSATIDGRLDKRDVLLRSVVRPVNGAPTIPGQYLPFIRLLLQHDDQKTKNIAWLKSVCGRKGKSKIRDQVVMRFLERELFRLSPSCAKTRPFRNRP